MLFTVARAGSAGCSALGIVGVLVSFLCWQVSGAPTSSTRCRWATSRAARCTLALPLILGSLAGVLCERSGVVNVAIEGQFLMGAFAAALFGTMAGERLGRPDRRGHRRRC